MHHGNRLILIPDLKAQAGFHQTPEKAAAGCFEQINEIEGSAGPQHAVHFTKRCLFLLGRNEAEHACAAHAVKGGVGIRKLVRKTAVEVDLNASSLGFTSRPGKRLRVGIESDDGDARMILLDQHGLAAGAATDIEDAMAGCERHLVSERPADGIAAQQLDQRIVDGQEPVPSRRRKIGSWGWAFRFFRRSIFHPIKLGINTTHRKRIIIFAADRCQENSYQGKRIGISFFAALAIGTISPRLSHPTVVCKRKS